MMSPADAHARLLKSGPFDDPTVTWFPYRWYFSEDGVMCCAEWRGNPVRYEGYTKDGEQS